ncbi:MAG: ribose-5-phosphate isomerase RpiA [Beijerinckiaceae bacterium]|jgi:ribose 5-phosphate isomerase A|nr:ribose-5-phosphate isomerase RpiA [Beijerinckiaceae bacterium]
MVTDQNQAKTAAAAKALEFVRPGMRLGLGTGSTAAIFVSLLGKLVSQGLQVTGVPTSERTRAQARDLNITLTTLDETPELDLTIDGADEFDSELVLIKGGGGALLREKIVAAASKRMIVITDDSKRVAQLGKFPLPVEVMPFGLGATTRAVTKALTAAGCHGTINLRQDADGHEFVTDGGHYILDCALGQIPDAQLLSCQLLLVPGVVETGLFINMASTIVVAGKNGVEILGSER